MEFERNAFVAALIEWMNDDPVYQGPDRWLRAL
jgi:hypothetical protein